MGAAVASCVPHTHRWRPCSRLATSLPTRRWMTGRTRFPDARDAGHVRPGHPHRHSHPQMSVHNARPLYLVLIWLFVGCLIVQVFLVGLDLFGEADPATHRTWAYIYGWLTPVLVFLASVGRLPRAMQLGSVALLVLFAVQTVLPTFREEFPLVAAAHALNALLIFWLAMVLARRARDAAAEPAPKGA